MTAPLPFEARNAVYTQRIVNRTVEATAPDGIELLTKHVFQSIVKVGAVAAPIVLSQTKNTKIQRGGPA